MCISARISNTKRPKEAGAIGYVWKLNKVVYGLLDASRAWYLKVVDELSKLGGRVSTSDKALFLWHQNNRLIGMLIVHVDDFVGCGTAAFGSNVIEAIKTIFKTSCEGDSMFHYIGLGIKQKRDRIVMEQNAYIDSINPVSISSERSTDKNSETTPQEKGPQN